MAKLTHLGQYWSAAHREVRLLGCAPQPTASDGRLSGEAFDLTDALPLPHFRRRFRDANRSRRWAEVRWTYSCLPFPTVELIDFLEASSQTLAGGGLEALQDAAEPLSRGLHDLDTAPAPERDHLVAPVLPRRAQGFGVTYLNSALERQTEGHRRDYAYVYRAVKERGERPELFLKGTASEHFVGPHANMGLRRDLMNSVTFEGEAMERVVVSAGIEPELAAVVYSTGEIWGYTLANDVSGNRIENETLLYLTQAKHFTGSFVLGPLIWLSVEQENPKVDIAVRVFSPAGEKVFEHTTNSSRINAPLCALIDWARSHVQLHPAEVFSTGTDCVPDGEVKVLQPGYQVEISSPQIGSLRHGAAVVPPTGDLNLDYSRIEFESESARA